VSDNTNYLEEENLEDKTVESTTADILEETVENRPEQVAENAEQESETSTPETKPDDDTSALKAELLEAKTQAEEYFNYLQRLKAEFDNFRKRTVKEKEEISKYASERIISSLLPVLDNFERALESAKKNKDFDSFSQGVEMIFRQFMKILEEEGLRPIEAVGKPFDPNLHEAMFREESDQEENIILEELQKGYYLKDKVIRPSRVKVSG